jgi:hypothetical protein
VESKRELSKGDIQSLEGWINLLAENQSEFGKENVQFLKDVAHLLAQESERMGDSAIIPLSIADIVPGHLEGQDNGKRMPELSKEATQTLQGFADCVLQSPAASDSAFNILSDPELMKCINEFRNSKECIEFTESFLPQLSTADFENALAFLTTPGVGSLFKSEFFRESLKYGFQQCGTELELQKNGTIESQSTEQQLLLRDLVQRSCNGTDQDCGGNSTSTDDSASGSGSKLPAGAIAGIAIAAVVACCCPICPYTDSDGNCRRATLVGAGVNLACGGAALAVGSLCCAACLALNCLGWCAESARAAREEAEAHRLQQRADRLVNQANVDNAVTQAAAAAARRLRAEQQLHQVVIAPTDMYPS